MSCYPLNFSFANTHLTKPDTFESYVNSLHQDDLYRLYWHDNTLGIEFTHVWDSIGLPADLLKISEIDECTKIQNSIQKGIIREKKVGQARSLPRHQLLLKVIKDECFNTRVISILEKLKTLKNKLLIGSRLFHEDEEPAIQIVSHLIMSHWICTYLQEINRVSVNDIWKFVIYDGSVKDHKDKMLSYIRMSRLDEDCAQMKTYFPLKKYFIISTNDLQSLDEIRMVDYYVLWYPEIDTVSDMIIKNNGVNCTFTHFIPHYGIYHSHQFRAEKFLIHYLEWTLFRALKEASTFRSELVNTDGLRCVRAGYLNYGDGNFSYSHFLNFSLLNVLYIDLNIERSGSKSDWHTYLHGEYMIRKERIKPEDYMLDNYVGIPNELFEYISSRLHEITSVNPFRYDITRVFESFLSVTYKTEFSDKVIIKKIGRIESNKRSYGTISLQGIPLNTKLIILPSHNIKFNPFNDITQQRMNSKYNIEDDFGICYSIIRTADANSRFRTPLVMEEIDQVRKYHYIRKLYDECLSILSLSDELLNNYLKPKISQALTFGDTLLLFSILEANLGVMIERKSTPRYKIHWSGLIEEKVNTINWSTPKLCSVLDVCMLRIKEILIHQGSLGIHIDVLNAIFAKVIILGAVENGDPIAKGLKNLCKSKVKQIGDFGINRVTRGRVEDMIIRQGYSAIISDIDMGGIENIDQLQNYVNETLLLYVNIIRPKFGVWKLNYTTYNVLEFILYQLRGSVFNGYFVWLVRPKFSKLFNHEMYFCFYLNEHAADDTLLYMHLDDVVDMHRFNMFPILRNSFTEFIFQTVKGFDDDILLTRQSNKVSTISILCEFDELEYALSKLLRVCDEVKYAYNGNTTKLWCLGTITSERRALSHRTIFEYSCNTNDFLHINIPSGGIRRDLVMRSWNLGTMVRQISREIIRRDVFDEQKLDPRTFGEKGRGMIIGIGDEQARGVLCVPTGFRYVVIDPKADIRFTKYNIEIITELFNFDSETEIEDLLTRIGIERGSTYIFAMFMLYTDALTKRKQLNRLSTLCDTLKSAAGAIKGIYFNIYSTEAIRACRGMLGTGEAPICLFGDVYCQKVKTGDTFSYKATFSNNYDLVETISEKEILETAQGADVKCLYISPHVNDVVHTLWAESNSCFINVIGGLEFGLSLSKVFKLVLK